LTVPAGTLPLTTTNPYIFTVHVSKAGKMPASYRTAVSVRKQSIPTVAVRLIQGGQQQTDGSILISNLDERIALHGTCSDQNASMLWSFSPAVGANLLGDRSKFSLGLSSADLVILGARALFVNQNIYAARLTCTTKLGLSSSAQLTLDVNAAPSGSGCEVCRHDRRLSTCHKTGLNTDQFQIRCDKFADIHAPLLYSFGYSVGLSSTSDVTWFAPTASKSFVTFLPSGLVTVHAYVQDNHGARSQIFEAVVTVTNPRTSGTSASTKRRLLQVTTTETASFFTGKIRNALYRNNAKEVNQLLSVAMSEIVNIQDGSLGTLSGHNTTELQEFLLFAVESLSDASSSAVITTEYAGETLGIAKLIAAASHTLAAAGSSTKLEYAVLAVSSLITELVSTQGVLMNVRSSEYALAAFNRLFAALAALNRAEQSSVLLRVRINV